MYTSSNIDQDDGQLPDFGDMSFNNLPTEIIEMVFHTHIYFHMGSRQTLLLTCRRWYTIATNSSSLWRNILWSSIGDTRYPVAVRCRSLAYLARIIERTGQATFELTLGLWNELPSGEEIQQFITLVGENWLSRCHKLTISGLQKWVYDDKISALQGIFLRDTFDALEDFTWIYPFNLPMRLTLNVLLGRVDVSAPRLRELTLDSVPEFPLLDTLNNIRIFRIIHGIITPSMWGKLINVEHLDIYPQSTLGLSTAPRLTSLCLRGRFFPHSLPSKDVLQKLTHLVLRFFDMGADENAPPLYLPLLKYLGIQFEPDTFYDGMINADKLEELTIVDMSEYLHPKIYLGGNVEPRSLHLYLRVDSHFEVHPPASSVWGKLEELHLTVLRGMWEIPLSVFRALCLGDKFAPLLRCLTIRHRTNGRNDPSQAQKHTRVQELRAIMKRRVEAGMTRLERLEIGWIHGDSDSYILGQDSEKWWVTEWTDCLRDGFGEEGDMLSLEAKMVSLAHGGVMQAAGLFL